MRHCYKEAVVANPEDLRGLAAPDEALAEIVSDRPEMSELAFEAHRLEDEPGGPIEDPAAIRALFGL